MDLGVILLLSLALAAAAVVAGAMALRQDRQNGRDEARGSLPGKGHHVIEVNYNSGAGGGTQNTSYRIPRDPQEYAKLFIPKEETR